MTYVKTEIPNAVTVRLDAVTGLRHSLQFLAVH
jgi:hypothetical protein